MKSTITLTQFVKAQTTVSDNSKSNIMSGRFIFIGFLLIIDQIILSKLQVQ